MRNNKNRRLNDHVSHWNARAVSLLITVLLMTGTVCAKQSHFQTIAEERQRAGDLIGAEKMLQNDLRAAAAVAPRSANFAGALAALGVFYHDIGHFSQAESCFTSSLGIFREIVGSDDLVLAPLVIHLAWLYVETGRPGEARRVQPEVWVERLQMQDPASRFLPMLLETIAGVNALEGRFDVARSVYKQDFELLARRGMTVSRERASALNNFGFIQLRAGRYADASSSFSQALPLWLLLSPPDDSQVAMSRLGLAEAQIALRRYDEAGDLLKQVLPVFEHNYGPNSLRTEDVLTRYAQVLRHQKHRDEAKKLEERAQLIRRASVADLSYKHVVNASDLGKIGVRSTISPGPTVGRVQPSDEPIQWRLPLITGPMIRRP